MSLSFLGKKSFHPSNPKNLKKLFESEEKARNELQKREELAKEHAMEETRRHAKSLMAARSGEKRAVEPPPSMGFMYQKPPGMAQAQAKAEKAQRPAERDAERFPLLKDAPRQGEYSLDIEVNHRPFGVELRKVRCSRCGEWGHQSGDRECSRRNELSDAERAKKDRLDPVGRIYGTEASGVPLRWEIKTTGATGGGHEILGRGSSAADANQQFVVDYDEASLGTAGRPSAAELAGIDPQLLAALSAKQQKKLLKMYTKELRALEGGADGGDGGDGDGGDGDNKRKKEKKEKKHTKEKKSKKHKRERRAGSEEGSGSDSDS